jgi:hypothetical protein
LYAHVIACTGWTWVQVDRLTIPRYMKLASYWQKHPPVHALVASYMGWKPPETAPEIDKRLAESVSSPENENAALELMRALSGG